LSMARHPVCDPFAASNEQTNQRTFSSTTQAIENNLKFDDIFVRTCLHSCQPERNFFWQGMKPGRLTFFVLVGMPFTAKLSTPERNPGWCHGQEMRLPAPQTPTR
ncbi:MAG: hypothetical protein H7839_20990, partial [Magnetococcus sp. YQC-5]